MLKYIRPSANSFFNCHNSKGIKLITRLPLVLIHLLENKFKQCFQESLNLFCSCGLDIEPTELYPIYCPCILTKDVLS